MLFCTGAAVCGERDAAAELRRVVLVFLGKGRHLILCVCLWVTEDVVGYGWALGLRSDLCLVYLRAARSKGDRREVPDILLESDTGPGSLPLQSMTDM